MGPLLPDLGDAPANLAPHYYRQLRACQHALEQLVRLKDHKDAKGKTDYYQQNQPLAWAEARAALDGSNWPHPNEDDDGRRSA